MLFEIVLYVKQRMAGRVTVDDGEIIAVVENGRRRDPKSTSLNAAVKHIMDNTDLEPFGQSEQIGRKSHFTTYRYTYQKPGCYVQSRYDRWAVAYPVESHWMVEKAGQVVKTRFENESIAKADVDAWVGYDHVGDLHKKTVIKNHRTEREYLETESECGRKVPELTMERRRTQAEQDMEDLFGL